MIIKKGRKDGERDPFWEWSNDEIAFNNEILSYVKEYYIQKIERSPLVNLFLGEHINFNLIKNISIYFIDFIKLKDFINLLIGANSNNREVCWQLHQLIGIGAGISFRYNNLILIDSRLEIFEPTIIHEIIELKTGNHNLATEGELIFVIKYLKISIKEYHSRTFKEDFSHKKYHELIEAYDRLNIK